MRVRWYHYKYNGFDKEAERPIVEADLSNPIEGEVIATLPLPSNRRPVGCSSLFVVALDDNSFAEVPISMCEMVKDKL